MKKTVLIALSAIFMLSCIEDDNMEKFATFEEATIVSYLEKNSETYSEYLELVKSVGLYDLLNAYGKYTVFAPTNDALRTFYAENGSPDEMSLKDKKELVYNHILTDKVNSSGFPVGSISAPTFSDNFITCDYQTGESNPVIVINNGAKVISIDKEVHNGVIHTIDKVIVFSKVIMPDAIKRADDGRFSLFAEALFATGMNDSLMMTDDLTYEQKLMPNSRPGSGSSNYWTPPFLKHGATAFIESDSTYHAHGLYTLDDLKRYAADIYDKVYPSDADVTDITDRRNSLNRFVSYHLMNRAQAENEFISADIEYFYVPGTTIYQYMEMMCPYTLLEISSGNLINKRKNGDAIRFLKTNYEAMNGYFHEIDGILTYDKGMEDDVLNKRLRMDIASMIPEFITNKLRNKDIGDSDRWYIPQGYMSTLWFSENTQANYISCTCWCNMDGDEFMMGNKYDLTLRLPPIPAGTYEIRCGFAAYGNRGVMQVYFDGSPCGIPVDMNKTGSNPQIGWVRDDATEDEGVQNDKMMHNRGYMKGPNTIYVKTKSSTMRDDSQPLRKILTTRTLEKTEPHLLRFKSVEDRTDMQCHLDYMEFIPIGLLYAEGKD
jgi:uncharacterized surface protein with fasciclin (FAS1) repeats